MRAPEPEPVIRADAYSSHHERSRSADSLQYAGRRDADAPRRFCGWGLEFGFGCRLMLRESGNEKPGSVRVDAMQHLETRLNTLNLTPQLRPSILKCRPASSLATAMQRLQAELEDSNLKSSRYQRPQVQRMISGT
jgi:hypothetical protein